MLRAAWSIILLACYCFIAAGALNAGFSRFSAAIPFMVFACFIAKRHMQPPTISYITYLIVAGAITINVTLTKNPYVFPILLDGHVEVLSDGYIAVFPQDGSGGFTTEPHDCKNDLPHIGCPSHAAVKAGDKYQVVGVALRYPDFSTHVTLLTDIGPIAESDFLGTKFSEPKIRPSKDVHASWASDVSTLMYWPIVFSPPYLELMGFVLFVIAGIVLIKKHALKLKPPANCSRNNQ